MTHSGELLSLPKEVFAERKFGFIYNSCVMPKFITEKKKSQWLDFSLLLP